MKKTHGLRNHRLYRVWADIKTRCYNTKSHCYEGYGGRGIKMCEQWKNDFMLFYQWGIDNGYEPGLEIDRYPNNDGNYEPGNCRWATRKENADNTRRKTVVEIGGVIKTAAEWATETGIDRKCIYHRIKEGLTGIEAVYGKRIMKKYNKCNSHVSD